MREIKVCKFIESSFSNAQALKLREEISKELDNGTDKIILNFEGITRFTTLFFNFSLGYYLKKLGKEKYDEIFEIINLSDLGKSTYNHSYNNSLNDKIKNQEISNAILDILNNITEE